MNKFHLTLAAVLLTGAALPAFAVDTKPVINPGASSAREATMAPNQNAMSMQNNAQAGTNDIGQNAAPNTQRGNMQTAMNTTSSNTSISSDPSSTERKGMHLSKAQERRANRAEAQTTRELNQQAAAMAAPANS
jgi:hypothetical protein